MTVGEFSAQIIETVCPSLASRMKQNARAQVKYRQLLRDKPMNPKQVYSEEKTQVEIDEDQLRKLERWKRHLSRYARFYDRTRTPDQPTANDLFRDPNDV